MKFLLLRHFLLVTMMHHLDSCTLQLSESASEGEGEEGVFLTLKAKVAELEHPTKEGVEGAEEAECQQLT